MVERSIAKFRKERMAKEKANREHQAMRIRTMKRSGMSNVAIAKQLDISESTVRTRLQEPVPPEENLLNEIGDILRNAQQNMVQDLSDSPALREVFGEDAVIVEVLDGRRGARLSTQNGRIVMDLDFKVLVNTKK